MKLKIFRLAFILSATAIIVYQFFAALVFCRSGGGAFSYGFALLKMLPMSVVFLALSAVASAYISIAAAKIILRPATNLIRRAGEGKTVSSDFPELETLTKALNQKNEQISEKIRIIDEERSIAVAAQQSKNELIANISHEMNTPLTSIKGFAELLTTGKLEGEKAKAAADTIVRQSEKLSALIGNIINFSEIDGDDLPPYEVDVNKLIGEAVRTFEPRLKERSISLILDTEHGIKVLSRNERINGILNNLIGNAIRYNKEGGSITVQLKGGIEPFLRVSDTGIGISEENIGKIFSRFYTVDKSHSGKGGGFGLGLAVVKKLVNKSGWDISVESKVNVGTAFTVKFYKP